MTRSGISQRSTLQGFIVSMITDVPTLAVYHQRHLDDQLSVYSNPNHVQHITGLVKPRHFNPICDYTKKRTAALSKHTACM